MASVQALDTRRVRNIAGGGLVKRNVLKPASKFGAAKTTTTKERTILGQNVIEKKPIKVEEVQPMEVEAVVPEAPLEVIDIDKNDTEDPQLCAEFASDIFQYMLWLEMQHPVKQHYLQSTTLKPKMRSILVDWLLQVHQRFKLLQETAYLTVAILDRFLELQPIPRVKLQLAGVSAMLVASKYEEMFAPEVNDFVYITDRSFSKEQIIAMEINILQTLGFNLGRPLPLQFLRRYSKAGEVDASHHMLAKYLLELAMVDYNMCHVRPSKQAAAALCLSLKILEEREWDATLQHYSSYSYEDIHPVVCHLAKNLQGASTCQYVKCIRIKYSSNKNMKIANYPALNSSTVTSLAKLSIDYTL